MRYPRFLFGLLCVATGVLLGLGDLFLIVWDLVAGGAHDIRGRGPFLLAFMLPQVGIASVLVTSGLAIAAAHRSGWPLWVLFVAPLAATALAFAICYLDPTLTLWRAMRPIRRAVHVEGAFAVDMMLLGIGVWLVRGRERTGVAAPIA